MLDKFYVCVFLCFKFLVKHLSDTWLNRIINVLAKIGWLLGKKYNKIARVNLDLAYETRMSDKEKEIIIQKCYKNLLHLVKDSIINQTITREQLLEKVTIHNEHFYTEAIQRKKGVIFLTAHYGNWEVTSLAVGAKWGPISVIGRKLDSPTMNTILERNRQRFNVTLLEKKGAMRGIIKALKNGENIGLLVDQNTASNEGVLISFFGKQARHTPAAAQFANKTNSTIIPAFVTTNDYKHYDLTFYEPILPSSATQEHALLADVQAQANATQYAIEQKPDEWFWFHKRWKNQYEELYRS